MEQKIPKGFKFLGKHVGIKKKKLDFGVIFSEKECVAAGVFTKNSCCGVSIPIGRNCLKNNELQAIVVTSGIANVATGEEGHKNAQMLTLSIAQQLKIEQDNVLPSSTGVIGPQLPIDIILKNTTNLEQELGEDNLEDFAIAIHTTDKSMKIKSKKIGSATITGIAKGSGMLEPNMATMLVYIVTDALVEQEDAYSCLKYAVDETFNKMSIDTDTSTSDTVILMANGMSEKIGLEKFKEVLKDICFELTMDILHDAEGATHLIKANVINSGTKEEAYEIGKSIINSPLVKTAVFGNDPNWGRIVMAIGKTNIKDVDLNTLSIAYKDLLIYERGNEVLENYSKIHDYLRQNKDIEINIDLGMGNKNCSVFGCDLSTEYVEFNSYYST